MTTAIILLVRIAFTVLLCAAEGMGIWVLPYLAREYATDPTSRLLFAVFCGLLVTIPLLLVALWKLKSP